MISVIAVVAAYGDRDKSHVFLADDLFVLENPEDVHSKIEEFRERVMSKANVKNVEIYNMLGVDITAKLRQSGYVITKGYDLP